MFSFWSFTPTFKLVDDHKASVRKSSDNMLIVFWIPLSSPNSFLIFLWSYFIIFDLYNNIETWYFLCNTVSNDFVWPTGLVTFSLTRITHSLRRNGLTRLWTATWSTELHALRVPNERVQTSFHSDVTESHTITLTSYGTLSFYCKK